MRDWRNVNSAFAQRDGELGTRSVGWTGATPSAPGAEEDSPPLQRWVGVEKESESPGDGRDLLPPFAKPGRKGGASSRPSRQRVILSGARSLRSSVRMTTSVRNANGTGRLPSSQKLLKRRYLRNLTYIPEAVHSRGEAQCLNANGSEIAHWRSAL